MIFHKNKTEKKVEVFTPVTYGNVFASTPFRALHGDATKAPPLLFSLLGSEGVWVTFWVISHLNIICFLIRVCITVINVEIKWHFNLFISSSTIATIEGMSENFNQHVNHTY